MHRHDRLFYMMGAPGPGGPGGMPGPGPGFGGPMFDIRMHRGGGFGWGGPGGRGRRRIRRGDVRAAILLLLEEEPRNGYQVMQELETRSGGVWRPSPGSVYPALQLLADEGLVRGEARDGGNVFELTDAGRKHVEEHRERLGTPWEQAGADLPDGVRQLGGVFAQVAVATRQVMHAGTTEQAKAAAEILADARRALYRILAEE
jgi:DNA-binding PadR family transcriptional regulator